jgi:chloramphenicol 3-O phosphotransferase
MTLPDLILLNGSTSAGKTAVCKALQEILPAGYLHFSVDDVFPWTPPRWHGSGEGFRMEHLPGGELAIFTGPEGRRIMRGWRHMVRAALDQGLRAVVDEVFLEDGDLAEWAAAMRGRDVLFVGVRCELSELQRRERARGDRGVGQALWQHARVHAQGLYDVEVDTTSTSAEACAQFLLDALPTRPRPSAFERPAG